MANIHCYRCDGTGYIPEYDHVESGKCFLCDGAGYISPRLQEQAVSEKVPVKRGKTVYLEGLGNCRIAKNGDEIFSLECDYGKASFRVINGTISVSTMSPTLAQKDVKDILQKNLKMKKQ